MDQFPIKQKKRTLFECQCISHESANWGHYILRLLIETGPPFYVVSREGLAGCSAKEVPSFLSRFKTLSVGPAPGIKLSTTHSAIKHSTH